MKKTIFLILILLLLGFKFSGVRLEYSPVISEDASDYTITTNFYTATVNKSTGNMTSLVVSGVERFGSVSGASGIQSTEYGVGGVVAVNFVNISKSSNIILVTLSKGGENYPLTYTFYNDYFTLTYDNQTSTISVGMRFTVADNAELVDTTGSDAWGDLGQFSLPVQERKNRIVDLKFTYNDSVRLEFDVAGQSDGINADENGTMYMYTSGGRRWTRRFFNVGQEYVCTFKIIKDTGLFLASPVFSITDPVYANCYETTNAENVTFDLDFDLANYQKILDNNITGITVNYTITDFWGDTILTGNEDASFDGSDPYTVTINPDMTGYTGWYQIDFTVSNDALFDTGGTNYFAIVTDTTGLVNLPITGVNAYEVNGFLGLKLFREYIVMTTLFDDEGVPPDAGEWATIDSQISAAGTQGALYGVTPFFTLDNKPSWVDTKEEYGAMIADVADRYKTSGIYWELYNEPNNFGISGTTFADYTKEAHTQSHVVDNDVVILSPSLLGFSESWMDDFIAGDGVDYSDIVSIHPYTGHDRSLEEHGIPQQMQILEDQLIADGHSDKEVWFSENGWLVMTGGQNQARNIVRELALANSWGITIDEIYYYYTLYRGYSFTSYLIDSDDHFRKAAVAVRIRSEQLNDKEYQAEYDIGKTKRLFQYHNATENVLTAWAYDYEDTKDIDITSATIKIYDMMGNLVSDYSTDNATTQTITLSLSGYPIYIHVDSDATIDPLTLDVKTNLALTATPTASSETAGYTASEVNDEVWNAENSGSYENRVWKASNAISTEDGWVQLTWGTPQTFDEVMVYYTSTSCGLPGLRDFKLQYYNNGWIDIENITDAWEWWIHKFNFDEITTDRIRIYITDLNNGQFLDDARAYTDMKPRISEIEVYNR